MRRFITTIPGRVLSHLAAVSLLLPFGTLFMASRASAQFAQLPVWIVVDFVNSAPQGGDFGKLAAEGVASELGKTNKYDVTPIETVRRTAESLGLQMPIPYTKATNLLRLGQELKADSIVTGEILNYRIVASGGTKHADVIMRVVVLDAGSAMPVNGAAMVAHSADRVLSAPDQTLLQEAISAAAGAAVIQIQGQALPHGTLLNTREKDALINQGSRTGFENGQHVIILRGKEQVATGDVYDVEADQAYIHLTSSRKGIQPGDRVRVLFSVPDIDSKFPKDVSSEKPVFKPSKQRPPSTGLIQLLLLVGVVGVLFSGGKGGSNSAFNSVISEAGLFTGIDPSPDPASGLPGVRISWVNGPFFRGNQTPVQYQVYRLQPSEVAAILTPSVLDARHQAVDSTANAPTITGWASFPTAGGITCANTALPGSGNVVAGPPLVLGVPTQYAVELVYKMSSLDLPNPGGTVQDCFFVTQQSIAAGISTALLGPGLLSPTDGSPITGPITFTFNAPSTPNQLNLDYAVEVSSDTMFVAGKTVVVSTFSSQTLGVQSTSNLGHPQIDLSTTNTNLPLSIRQAQTLYWRAGVRNHADLPGPVPDAINQRYIFSARYFTLTRPLVPPGG